MHMPSKEGAGNAFHKMHFLCHSGYLTAAALEGHLLYSVMAALTLLFMVGCAVIGHGD